MSSPAGSLPFSRKAPQRLRLVLLALTVLLCFFLTFCYAVRPDACAAITIFPVWAWLAPGLLLVAAGWHRRTRRQAVIGLLLWLVYLLVFAEEPRSLLRAYSGGAPGRQTTRAPARMVRVASLNCAAGDEDAAAELLPYHPDIVLLQESPGRWEIEALARRFFGKDAGVLWGVDASLLARGKVTAVPLPSHLSLYCAQARVRLTSGLETGVISIRLLPPIAREDLWNPACWRDQNDNRRARREQVLAAQRQIETVPRTLPLVLGGDLNAPAGDAALRPFRARLHDTFPEGGRGWGNTVLNDFPVLRIDQVWASKHFRAVSVRARQTQHSDHRLVICDLLLRPQ